MVESLFAVVSVKASYYSRTKSNFRCGLGKEILWGSVTKILIERDVKGHTDILGGERSEIWLSRSLISYLSVVVHGVAWSSKITAEASEGVVFQIHRRVCQSTINRTKKSQTNYTQRLTDTPHHTNTHIRLHRLARCDCLSLPACARARPNRPEDPSPSPKVPNSRTRRRTPTAPLSILSRTPHLTIRPFSYFGYFPLPLLFTCACVTWALKWVTGVISVLGECIAL